MLTGRSPTRTSRSVALARPGKHAQRLAQHVVHAARGDLRREADILHRRADRDARVGPRNHVVAEDRLHDRPRAGVVPVDSEMHDLTAQRTDRERHAELLRDPARPRTTRDHDRVGREGTHVVDRFRAHVDAVLRVAVRTERGAHRPAVDAGGGRMVQRPHDVAEDGHHRARLVRADLGRAGRPVGDPLPRGHVALAGRQLQDPAAGPARLAHELEE